MSCVRWRKTYRKVVAQAPGELQYLLQTSYSQGIWVILTVNAGNASPGVGAASLWSVPIADKLASSDWKIVPPHQKYLSESLQLEVRVEGGVAQFRLANKLTGITLEWLDITILVFGQDDPIIQELTGTGTSLATAQYLPADAGSSFDPSELLARLDALEADNTALHEQILAETAARVAEIEAERQARLALMARINALWTGDGPYWEPVTNGDLVTPEIVFDSGDVVMALVTP